MRSVSAFSAGLCAVGLLVGACSDDEQVPAAGTGGATAEAGASTGGTSATGGRAGDASSEADAHDGDASDAAADAPADRVARGAYLVNTVIACPDCHTPRVAEGAPDVTKHLAGNANFAMIPTADGGFLRVGSTNLTPDMETGLGKWTDAQIKKAFLDGIDDEGHPLLPLMPYYVLHNMREEDADAIVAYLRSIPPVQNPIPDNEDPPAAASPVPLDKIPTIKLEASDPNYASAQRGQYLAAKVGVCMECHTKEAPGQAVPIDVNSLFAGGRIFLRNALRLPPVFPEVIMSANITPHATGIAGWTPEDFRKAVKTGLTKEGELICPPMPVGPHGAFAGFQDGDVLDIGTYLLSIAPIENSVPKCMLSDAGPPSDGGSDAAADGSRDSSSSDAPVESSNDAAPDTVGNPDGSE